MADPFVAEIRIVGFNFAPTGWALCNGQLMPISQNTALFSLLGTQYGGDGKTTFALPNLQGRVPIHAGQGPGLTDRAIGESGGAATVTLTAAEMPSHSHAIATTSAPADRSNPASSRFAAPADSVYTAQAANTATHPSTVGSDGGNQPHNNLQPFLVLNFVIALQGIFPPRS
jgi:microcystin-dependent protein